MEIIKEETAKEELDIYRCAKFAELNLAPRAPTNPVWKDQLEKTMALLIFDHNNLVPELHALISPQKRVQVAEAANTAILRATGEAPMPGLNELLQSRVYAETEARNLSRWPAGTAGLNIGLDETLQVTGGPSNGGGANIEDEVMVG